MLLLKNESIKPLLNSVNGIHLTAYIKNSGDLNDLKLQIQDTIDSADEYLVDAMKVHEIEKFLDPIQKLIKDEKRLKNFNGNLGIFRTMHSFRVLNLPIQVENSCFVADTFHVKPLIRWMQLDPDFLLVTFDTNSVSLYRGSMNSFKLIDSLILTDSLSLHLNNISDEGIRNYSIKELQLFDTIDWLEVLMKDIPFRTRPRIFVAGKKKYTNIFLKNFNYDNVAKNVFLSSFHTSDDIHKTCAEIRNIMKAEAKKAIEKNLVEFYYAGHVNLATRNIFEIARAAVQGKIRKLLISDGINIFGKLNRKTGKLSIHQKDLDHEDDDILDDLAQLVLANGGEVTVAPSSQIPNRMPILAIVDEPPQSEMSTGINKEKTINKNTKGVTYDAYNI